MFMKRERKRLQRRHVERQKAHGEDLRAWLHDRRVAAEKRLKERRIQQVSASVGKRGRDRVPVRFQGPRQGEAQYLHQHSDTSYADRRRRAERGANPASARMARPPAGKLQVRSGSNVPYVNKAKDRTLAGKKRRRG